MKPSKEGLLFLGRLVALGRINTLSTRKDFVDHNSIRKNQVFIIIITILVQFHLPYFSLSPALAVAMSAENSLDTVVSLENDGVRLRPSYGAIENQVFSFNQREIPYLSDKTSDNESRDDAKPKLLGIHVAVPGGAAKRAPALAAEPGSTRTIVVTAYSSTKDQTDSSPCITANGFNVCEHGNEDVVAANFLPFGTRVQFPDHFGDREFIVQDRMNARYSNRVDIWMKSRGAAKQFGVRRLKMVVVPENVAEKDSGNVQVAGNF